MFLLDASSSMGHGSDWLGTCKDCMHRLFRQTLQPGDFIGLLAFQHGIVADLPLAAWDDRHRDNLERALGESSTNLMPAILTTTQCAFLWIRRTIAGWWWDGHVGRRDASDRQISPSPPQLPRPFC